MEWIIREFIEVGKLLFSEGLVSARAGNLSRAFGEELLITRTGSNLGNLTEHDIITLPLRERHILEKRASVELIVHRKVLSTTARRAVLHAHPTYTLLMAYKKNLIEPVDSEGREILGKVSVLELEKVSASQELADAVSEVLKDRELVVVKGHGVFSAHRELRNAYSLLSTLEHSCKILYLMELGQRR